MEEQQVHPDRRNISRFELRLRSLLKRLQNGEEVVELFTRDVSSKGAFFLTSEPLPIDTTLDMTLFLPVGQTLHSRISVAGKVVRTEDEGMAVRFDPGYTLAPA
jgi:PilZ domain